MCRRVRRPAVVAPLALLALLAWGGAASAGELFAEQMTAETAPRLRMGGIHAVGGVGDWALGNGVVCAVIADARHETVISPFGGVPVDLGHCGRNDDQLPYWEAIRGVPAPTVTDVVTTPFDLASRRIVDGAETVASDPDDLAIEFAAPEPRLSAEVADGEARVRVDGPVNGVRVTTVFALGHEEPRALRVRTRLERLADGPKVSMVGGSILHGNASLRPFTLSKRSRWAAGGFDHPPVDPDDPISLAMAMRPVDWLVLVGDSAVEPGIAYGIEVRAARLERADGSTRDLPVASVSGEHFSLTMALVRPPWIGRRNRVGLLEMAQLSFMDIAVGDAVVLESVVHVGARADVASVTDLVYPTLPDGAAPVSGRVDDPDVSLHVDDWLGRAVTQVRPGPDGGFRFMAPPGRHKLEVRSVAGVVHQQRFEVEAEPVELGLLRVAAPGRVRLPRAGPMRLVFQGIEGSDDPVLDGDLLGLRFGKDAYPSATSANHLALVGGPADRELLALPPGRYRVLATRGPEFSVTEARVEVRPGETTSLAIAPPARVIETPGWVAADLHVHAAGSFDSAFPWRRQIAAFAAQGGEVVVATDHHVITDPAAAVTALDLQGEVVAITGTEVTNSAETRLVPYTIGHANAFPLDVRPLEYRRGGPPSSSRRLRTVIGALRERRADVLVQLNHPRSAPGESPPSPFYYLDNMAVVGRPFRASRPLHQGDNRALVEPSPETGVRDIDFDALELWNGPSRRRYQWTRAAWFSLLLQGEVRTATANSDSHRAGQLVALPRSYVRVASDDLAGFDESGFVEAVRAGRVMGTSGPWLDVSLGDAGVGELWSGRAGELRVAARAAPWVPLEELRVFVDAELVWRGAIADGQQVRVPLDFERDAFVMVEAEGDPDARFRALAPGFRSFAYTNPIFVDADGDGRWQAPGFSAARPPDTLANPSRPARLR